MQTGWQAVLESNRSQLLAELLDFLRIESVSTSPDHVADVKQAGNWVASRLRSACMENVQTFPTGIHECVYADWLHAPGKPTILVYGHFDVQPADPLDLWDSPPFEPVVRDGKVFARGTCDMKANLLLCIAAAEAVLKAEGQLPVNLKFLFEGQEEIGSRDLGPFVAGHKGLLACDLILTPDSLQWTEDQPVMWLGTKGLCGMQVNLETASMDLHSGLYGGAVPNALHAMVRLLDTLRDANGSILVDGFFDQVVPISDEERRRFAEIPFDWKAYGEPLGVHEPVGEPGYSTYERAWARPTLELNGIWGGYQGDGVKTVIPCQAHAKITCRLVANQNPADVLDRLESHMISHCPPGVRMTMDRLAATADPYLLPIGHAGVRAVAGILRAVYGREPYFARIGGSLPITAMFLRELGAYTVPLGFALEDERMHSPNEFMRLSSFEKGQVVYGLALKKLGELEPGDFASGVP